MATDNTDAGTTVTMAFVASPLAVALIDGVGWQNTLITFGAAMLLVLPLSLVLATRPAEPVPGAAAPGLCSGRATVQQSSQLYLHQGDSDARS
jgi:hypothetical protein